MATKKRTSKKAGKKASSARRSGKKTARKKTNSKKAGSKKASSKKNRFTINPGLPTQTRIWASVSRWKRRTPKATKAPRLTATIINPGLPSQTKLLLPSAATTALVKAVETASATPRSGPLVGAPGGGHGKKKGTSKKGTSKKKGTGKKKSGARKATKKKAGLSKAEFLKKMAEGRAKAAAKKGRKKTSKKQRAKKKGRPSTGNFAQKMQAARAAKASRRAAKKSAGKSSKALASSKKKATVSSRKPSSRKPSRRKGWPRVGKNKRTFGIPKFKAMNALGVPPNHPITKAKKASLREAAGRGISAKQVFDMARATSMKAWICAGKVRTGCGGGAAMLKGSHQIGVFGVGRR